MARIRIQEPIHLVLSQMPNHLNPNAAETAALLGRGRSDRGLAGRRSKHEWTTTHRRYAFHTSSTYDATPPYHRTTLRLLRAKASHACSGNQRGRNNGPHDVQNQDERTHAYRSSVAPSHLRAHMLFRSYKMLSTCSDRRGVRQQPITLLARGIAS